jgi:hypothetical protein
MSSRGRITQGIKVRTRMQVTRATVSTAARRVFRMKVFFFMMLPP